jgi:hypothetical protein
MLCAVFAKLIRLSPACVMIIEHGKYKYQFLCLQDMPGDMLRVYARACGHCGIRHRPRAQCAQQQSVHESQIDSVPLLSSVSKVSSQLCVPFEASVG